MRNFLRRLPILLLLASCLAGWQASATSVSQPTFWRYAHPRAKALIGIDWRGVVNSPAGAKIAAEIEKAGMSGKIGGDAAGEGIELLRGLERILISSPGEGGRGAKENPPAVIAMSGNFDLAKLRRMVSTKGARKSSYRSIEIINSPNARDKMCVALVSPQIVLVGDRPSVQAAIDNHGSADASALDDPLYQRAAEMSSHYQIWFLGEVSPADFAGGNVPQAAMFSDIESLEGGISLRDGLGLQLNMNARNEESARTLGTGIQALMQLATMGNANQPEMQKLAQQLQVGLVGSQVQVALALSQEDLDRGVSQVRSGMVAQAGFGTDDSSAVASAGEPPAATQSASAPSRPMAIRIYNMDGGTRVIPYSKR